MRLSSDLISEFVKITNDRTKSKQESTVYGTVVKDSSRTYVRLDGSDILTPVSTTADAQDGERVTVLIKNHSATITGNVSSPAARTGDVQQLGDDVSNLNEENLVISGKLTAAEADISTLKTEKLNADTAEITYAKITDLEATNAELDNLEATHGAFETLTAQNFEAVDAKIGQFVSFIEGTSGNWSYKKWSNGDAELWGSQSVSGVACTTAFGDSMYRSNAVASSAFPFTVYSPILTASYESNGYGAFLWATSITTTTSPPTYYLIRATSGTINSGKINFHVTGKWTS